MLFCSRAFLVFFAVVFSVYWLLPWRRARVWLLLGASFYFYASWNQWLAVLICFSSLMDYLIARGMDASRTQGQRRALLGVSLVANLGLLVYFKYANFFLQSLEQSLRAAGFESSMPLLEVILPVGISFYTFEAINYTVDVYRRHVPAERDLGNLMLFILFFPHLVAGPIVRARDFLPQIHRHKRFDWARMQLGAHYFLMGLFKKLAIADRMAIYVDPVFADPAAYSSLSNWVAILAYSLQIYCDFSGYTDMALGVAHMLGYKLTLNFNMPYRSLNVSEFWRRWHISLSSWLRDYLFIPLGGSRGSSWRTSLNLLITMVLGGLWHGANWTFAVWGLLHGLYLIVHRVFRDECQKWRTAEWLLSTVPGMALRMTLTYLAVSLAWVFFRAQDFTTAMAMLQRLAAPMAGRELPLSIVGFLVTAALVVVCHAVARRRNWMAEKLPVAVLGIGYAAMLTFALLLAPDAGKAFIYFQF